MRADRPESYCINIYCCTTVDYLTLISSIGKANFGCFRIEELDSHLVNC